MLFPLHRTSCASGDQDSTIYLPVSKGFAVLWAILIRFIVGLVAKF